LGSRKYKYKPAGDISTIHQKQARLSSRPLRLCENRRPNEKANLAQRRKGAAIYFSKTIKPYRILISIPGDVSRPSASIA